MNAFKDGLLFLYEKMKLYKEMIACYMQSHDHEGLIACCKKLGDSTKGDPSLWADLLKYFGELGEDCSNEVKEVLTYIERNDVLPPIVILQTLSKNPCLTLSVVKDYIARKLEHESKLIEDDRRYIEKYQEETALMRKEIQDLRTNARIFQLSNCTACTFTLDLPAVPIARSVVLEGQQPPSSSFSQAPCVHNYLAEQGSQAPSHSPSIPCQLPLKFEQV